MENNNYNGNGFAGGNNKNKNKKDDDTAFHVIAWIITIAALSIWWPLGLVMLFLNLSGKIDKFKPKHQKTDTSASRNTQSHTNNYTYNYTHDYNSQQPKGQNVSYGKKAEQSSGTSAKNTKKKIPSGKAISVLLLILGVILILVGGSIIADEIKYIEYGIIWSDLIQGIFYIIGGAASLVTRWFSKRRHGRFVKYSTILGDNEIISVSSISKSSGVDMKTVRKELQIMIDKGYFGESAYIDADIDSLVLSPEAANKVRHFAEEAAKKAQQYAQQESAVPENEYMNILSELRSLNDDIADESISSKISRIEEIAGKIFRIVDEEPDKLPQIRRFMDYYLPTTLKLLRSYSVLERQGIDGENISSAKADIDRILDTLIKGYEQQLDLLFKADAIDISSDIDVLETMLRKDGLKDDNSGFGTTAGGI